MPGGAGGGSLTIFLQLSVQQRLLLGGGFAILQQVMLVELTNPFKYFAALFQRELGQFLQNVGLARGGNLGDVLAFVNEWLGSK